MASRIDTIRNWRPTRKTAVGVDIRDQFAKALFSNPNGNFRESGSNPNGPNRGGGQSQHRHRAVGGLWVQACYALIDIFCVVVNGTAAFFIRFSTSNPPNFLIDRHFGAASQPVARYGAFLLLDTALIILFCHFQDLYRTPRTRTESEESFSVFKAISFASLLLMAFIYLSGIRIVSRFIVLISFLLNVTALVTWRYAKRRIVIRRVDRGIGTRNVLVIGAGRVGQALAEQFEHNKLLGYRFVGFLDSNHYGDPLVLGKVEDLGRISQAEFVDEIFITIPSERELVKRIATEARLHRLDVKVVPDLYDGLAWNVPIRHVGDFPVMEIHWRSIPTLGLFVKRVFDVILSCVILVVCSPLLVVLAIWIKFDSQGPVFYRSRRVGKKGRIFSCYKLRTMVCNADELKDSLRNRNERHGPFFKIENDPRITGFGRFLRKYSLDELPQVWNVLKGDMSLVGPRPHPLDDYSLYSLDHLRRLDVKPGITGLWQIKARQNPSFERNMELDLGYIDNWSLWLDLEIALRTVPAILRAEGS